MFIDIEVNTDFELTDKYQNIFSDIAQMALYTVTEKGKDLSHEVGLILTDDNDIRLINKTYRGIDSPTDVLSFPMYEKDEIKDALKSECMLGDIIISVPTMKAQAKEYGHSDTRELAFLFTHGILHLLGFDHVEEKEREEMESLSEEILKKIGITRDN